MSEAQSLCSQMLECLERPQRPPKDLIYRARSFIEQEERYESELTKYKLFEMFQKCPSTLEGLCGYLEDLGWMIMRPEDYSASNFVVDSHIYYWHAHMVMGWEGVVGHPSSKGGDLHNGYPLFTISPEVSTSLLPEYTQVRISIDAMVDKVQYKTECFHHLCDLSDKLGLTIQTLYSSWKGLQNPCAPC